MKHGMRWVWIVAAALAAGCGEDPPPESAASPAKNAPSVPASATQQATTQLIEGMVSAVKADATPAIVNVKFDLRTRPEAGKPLAISLVFVPQHEASALNATFSSDVGLTVPDGQPPAEFAPVSAGAGYTYELKVVPDANGVHYVSAVVQLQVGGVPRLQTFSVPVVVGPPPT